MNILYVNIGFMPANTWGGPAKVVYQNGMELTRRGHHVTVCASNLMNKKTRIGPGSFAVQEADIVHVNGIRNMLSMQAIRFASRLAKPLVIQAHGTAQRIVSSTHLKWVYDSIFMKRILNEADALIALQEKEVEQIVAAGGNPDSIHIVPNGIDSSNCGGQSYGERFRMFYGIPANRRIILFLGRINLKKGVDLLVEAFARIPVDERRTFQLVIAGPDDGHLHEVQSLIARHQLEDQVLYTGFLAGGAVWDALASADLFVLPCRTDTFPMALLEACCSGTPILVTNTCEIADILSGKAALSVPLDVDAIAVGMRRILADEELQARLARGARQLMLTKFSIQTVGDKLEAIYFRLAETS
jgi:glycosyltransferase involved in cell wall biosynthesis